MLALDSQGERKRTAAELESRTPIEGADGPCLIVILTAQ